MCSRIPLMAIGLGFFRKKTTFNFDLKSQPNFGTNSITSRDSYPDEVIPSVSEGDAAGGG